MKIAVNHIFWFVLLTQISACTAEDDLCVTGNKLSVVRVELKEALIAQLHEEGIPVSENDQGDICYPSDKAGYVRGELIALDLQQRPSNHITIAGGEFAIRVFKELDAAGIKYSYSDVDNKVILIVDEKDVDKIGEITSSVARSIAKGEK